MALQPCIVEGCDNQTNSRNQNGGYCRSHRHLSPSYQEKAKVWNAAFYEANPGYSTAQGKKWRAANPERYAESNKVKRPNDRIYARKALKRDLFMESVNRDVVFERDGGKCHMCLQLVDPSDWDLEHIIPLKDGGPHCYDNTAVAHPECNPWNKPAGSNNSILEVAAWQAFYEFHGLVEIEDEWEVA